MLSTIKLSVTATPSMTHCGDLAYSYFSWGQLRRRVENASDTHANTLKFRLPSYAQKKRRENQHNQEKTIIAQAVAGCVQIVQLDFNRTAYGLVSI